MQTSLHWPRNVNSLREMICDNMTINDHAIFKGTIQGDTINVTTLNITNTTTANILNSTTLNSTTINSATINSTAINSTGTISGGIVTSSGALLGNSLAVTTSIAAASLNISGNTQSNSMTLSNPLPVSSGGTGSTILASITVGTATNLANSSSGKIPVQTGIGTTGFITEGTSTQVLTGNGPGNLPTFQEKSISLTTQVTGILPVANGGTNSNSLATITVGTATNLADSTRGKIPVQTASGTTGFITEGTSTQVLTGNGAGNLPTFQEKSINLSTQVFNTLPLINGGTEYNTGGITLFTPTFRSNIAVTYTRNTGTCYALGRLVHVSIALQTTSAINDTATPIEILGCPFLPGFRGFFLLASLDNYNVPNQTMQVQGYNADGAGWNFIRVGLGFDNAPFQDLTCPTTAGTRAIFLDGMFLRN